MSRSERIKIFYLLSCFFFFCAYKFCWTRKWLRAGRSVSLAKRLFMNRRALKKKPDLHRSSRENKRQAQSLMNAKKDKVTAFPARTAWETHTQYSLLCQPGFLSLLWYGDTWTVLYPELTRTLVDSFLVSLYKVWGCMRIMYYDYTIQACSRRIITRTQSQETAKTDGETWFVYIYDWWQARAHTHTQNSDKLIIMNGKNGIDLLLYVWV